MVYQTRIYYAKSIWPRWYSDSMEILMSCELLSGIRNIFYGQWYRRRVWRESWDSRAGRNLYGSYATSGRSVAYKNLYALASDRISIYDYRYEVVFGWYRVDEENLWYSTADSRYCWYYYSWDYRRWRVYSQGDYPRWKMI